MCPVSRRRNPPHDDHIVAGRDAEDTRELLSHYFDLAHEVIARYGGPIEKFIGDAVMAVWGAPVAHEDDAERAVRAGLELVEALRSLDPAIAAARTRTVRPGGRPGARSHAEVCEVTFRGARPNTQVSVRHAKSLATAANQSSRRANGSGPAYWSRCGRRSRQERGSDGGRQSGDANEDLVDLGLGRHPSQAEADRAHPDNRRHPHRRQHRRELHRIGVAGGARRGGDAVE